MKEIPCSVADVEHGEQIRMGDGGGGARLLLEPSQPIGVARKADGQHLHGHVAAQPHVVRAIHVAHAAAAERRHDFVRAQVEAGLEHPFTRNASRDYTVAADASRSISRQMVRNLVT